MPEAIDVDKIKSLDDVPRAARMAARQSFLVQYARSLIILPFIVIIVISRFTPDSLGVPIVLGWGVWTFGALGYMCYLIFALRCPVCGWRYGQGSVCSSCGLPRYGKDASERGYTLLGPDV